MKSNAGLVVFFIVVFLLFSLVYLFTNEVEEIGTITDILSVSAGGFGSPTQCILMIDGEKGVYRSGACSLQIGDRLCKRQDALTVNYGKCEK